MQRHATCLCLLLFATLVPSFAQQLTQTTTGEPLALAVPHLYGPNGLTLPNPFHNAHFEGSFLTNFDPVNTSLSTQLSLLPIVSPASGYVYTFNSSLGTVTRTTESFGPVLTERAETIGKNKLFIGFTYQHYAFDKIDGLDIHNLPSVMTHADCCGGANTPGVPAFENDYITGNNNIDLKLDTFTWFATFGLTNRIDVSVAVPLVNASLRVSSAAHIVRIAAPDPVFGQAHYFDASNPNGSVDKTFISSGDATGIGDVSFRIKANAIKGERAGVAFGLDVRAPSGDAMNFLGTGAVGVRPFVAASYRARVSPHVNFGYQYNGNSILAGNPVTGTEGDLPDSLFYSGGVDIGMGKHFSTAFDYLGQHVIDAQRVQQVTYTAADGKSVPQIAFYKGSFDTADGSAGIKFSPVNKLLITGNVIFRLNSSGLRANVVPLVGISYIF